MKFFSALLLLFSGLVCVNSFAATSTTATAEAEKAGVKTCLPAIKKLETWLARGQSENALAFWDANAADQSLFTALLTLENKTSNSLVNLNALPTANGRCLIEYTQTGYVAQACADYLKSLGNSAKYVRDLSSKTALIQGQGVQILLSPAGKGCLWLRKEIIQQPD